MVPQEGLKKLTQATECSFSMTLHFRYNRCLYYMSGKGVMVEKPVSGHSIELIIPTFTSINVRYIELRRRCLPIY